MEKRKYKVVIAQSGKLDVKEKRNISFSNLNTGSMQRIFEAVKNLVSLESESF